MVFKCLKSVALVISASAIFIFIAAPAGRAQSADIKNPAPLTGREIIGQANYPDNKNGWARTFYYFFAAGPGEIKVSVFSKSPGRPGGGWFEGRFRRHDEAFDRTADTEHDARYSISFNETTTNHSHGPSRGRTLATVGLLAPKSKERREISKTLILPEKTQLIMIVNVSGRFDYRIKLDGPIIVVDPN